MPPRVLALAVALLPNKRFGAGRRLAALAAMAICIGWAGTTAQSQTVPSGSLNGRWVADSDRDFILNIDGSDVEGSYYCRHQPMGVRGELAADGTIHAWSSNFGTPSMKTKLGGKFPTVTITDLDFCPGDRHMHRG